MPLKYEEADYSDLTDLDPSVSSGEDELEPTDDDDYRAPGSSKRKTNGCSAVTKDRSSNGTTSKGKKGKGKEKQSRQKVEEVLQTPHAVTNSTVALYHLLHQGDVDLSPEYQRDVVWSNDKQIGLIDSMFKNYYVPPVIFSVKTDDYGDEKRTCIDGKQRLTAIYRFIEGTIPFRNSDTNTRLWYRKSNASKGGGEVLSDEMRDAFDSKQMVCVEYHNLTDENEREIFQRVQLGMALTPAEKMQASGSKRAAFVRRLLEQYAADETQGLANGSNIEWQKDRGGMFRRVAEAAYMLHNPKRHLTTMPDVKSITKWLEDGDKMDDEDGGLSEEFRDQMEETMKTLNELIDAPKYRGAFGPLAGSTSKKVAPVEILFSIVLVGRFYDRMDKKELANSIKRMRVFLKDKHLDLRANNRVAKSAIEFLHDLRNEGKGKKKNKRVQLESEDEDEEMSAPKPRKKVKGR